VWHDSFTCVTWLIHMCDMTHPYVRHDSFFLTDWQIFDSIYPIRCGFNLYILQSLISKSLRLYLYLTDLYNSTRCVFYESVHVPIKEDLSSIRLWIYSSFVCCWCATHCNTLQHTATHCNTLQHPVNLFIFRLLLMRTAALYRVCSTGLRWLRVHRAFICQSLHLSSSIKSIKVEICINW